MSERARRAASLFVLVVAALATMATSVHPRTALDTQIEGEVTLQPSQPEVRRDFRVRSRQLGDAQTVTGFLALRTPTFVGPWSLLDRPIDVEILQTLPGGRIKSVARATDDNLGFSPSIEACSSSDDACELSLSVIFRDPPSGAGRSIAWRLSILAELGEPAYAELEIAPIQPLEVGGNQSLAMSAALLGFGVGAGVALFVFWPARPGRRLSARSIAIGAVAAGQASLALLLVFAALGTILGVSTTDRRPTIAAIGLLILAGVLAVSVWQWLLGRPRLLLACSAVTLVVVVPGLAHLVAVSTMSLAPAGSLLLGTVAAFSAAGAVAALRPPNERTATLTLHEAVMLIVQPPLLVVFALLAVGGLSPGGSASLLGVIIGVALLVVGIVGYAEWSRGKGTILLLSNLGAAFVLVLALFMQTLRLSGSELDPTPAEDLLVAGSLVLACVAAVLSARGRRPRPTTTFVDRGSPRAVPRDVVED